MSMSNDAIKSYSDKNMIAVSLFIYMYIVSRVLLPKKQSVYII